MASLQEAWSMNDDGNFAAIGSSEASDDFGLTPPRPAELVAMGRRWMGRNREMLCRYVCPHERVRSALGSDNFGLDFCSIVLDVIEHHIAQVSPVPPASVAVLFVRLGYHKICAGYAGLSEASDSSKAE